jgi:pyruvate/2-oxoglutarate/acetoin dehydrogenase E1 component/TPP-dependent pyruvate/acetoin dehydrogenase alpha subunit
VIEARGHAAELSEAQLLEVYELMVAGRALETRLLALHHEGSLPGPFFPGIGQEAAQVGLAYALAEGDVYSGTHRDLMSMLVRGVTFEEVLLTMLGKAAGPTGGRDGASAGLFEKGILLVPAAVPDGHPVAAGCALAFAQRGEGWVAMANSGEGATAAGTWHEAVNTAAVLQLPVVFTIQNNQYAGSTPNAGEFHLPYAAHRADGYGIPGVVVDGNDVLDCYAAAAEAVERARSGGGPTLIEAVTFRHHGHDAGDPAAYVDPDKRDSWLARDPITRFEEFLGTRGVLDESRRSALADRVEEDLERTVAWADIQSDPEPIEIAVSAPGTQADPIEAEPRSYGYLEAIRAALSGAMAHDDDVFVLGQDVAAGGPYGVTRGLLEQFGPMRVVDLPVAEAALAGMAVGAALQGTRPVAELQSADYLFAALAQIAGQAALYEWREGISVPLVLRVPSGPGRGGGPHRSFSPAGLLARIPGLKIAVPASPAAAAGLLRAAIQDPGPVVLVEPRRLFSTEGWVPAPVTLGDARIARSGDDVTVITWGGMVPGCLEAAERAGAAGVSVEVIDLQTVAPLDWPAVLASVSRTGRALVVHDEAPFGGIAAEIAARLAGELVWDLDAPVHRIGPPHAPVPFAPALEAAFVPEADTVLGAITEIVSI